MASFNNITYHVCLGVIEFFSYIECERKKEYIMNNLYYLDLYGADDYYRSNCSLDFNTLDRKGNGFYNENEGFIKGNIQKNIYDSYRNYNPIMPNVNTDKERLLLEIQKYCFYLIDLGLYLDLHPNDKEALQLFNDNRNKYLRLINEFNKNYYPLMLVDSNNKDTYKWLNGSFSSGGGK